MGRIRESIFATIGKAYAFEILLFLEGKSPLRFTDIHPACKHEKVRAQRLRELEKEKLIEAKMERLKGRAILLYSLSNKGEKILQHMKEIQKIRKEI
ncbi:MAG: winged helix-turn-helix transcriptional regulator [Euryarchaeota archaeon]|nr:winged helix-turn-helix transcriptional regulator [Euryarchaeota archaeon]